MSGNVRLIKITPNSDEGSEITEFYPPSPKMAPTPENGQNWPKIPKIAFRQKSKNGLTFPFQNDVFSPEKPDFAPV